MTKNHAPDNRTAAQKFMDRMDKLRAIFGPAQRSSITHDMTAENKTSLAQAQAQMESEFETVTRPDGSTYIVPRQS